MLVNRLSAIATDVREQVKVGVDSALASLKRSEPLARLDRGLVRRIVLQATGLWLATRLMLLALTFIAPALSLVARFTDLSMAFSAFPNGRGLLANLVDGQGPLSNWVHWDANWYLLMGLHGYDVYTSATAGWFPLWPLAIHLGTVVFGGDQVLRIGLVLSSLAALAAFIGLGLLGASEERVEESAEESARRLMLIVAAYPFAFYLFAPFSEGFFLAFAVFALLFARTRRWWLAAACAFLAGLTRPTAVALILPFAWEFGRQHGLWQVERWRAWRAGAWRALLRLRVLISGAAAVTAIAAVPLAIVCFLAFLRVHYGSASLYQYSQDALHGHVNLPIWSTAKLLLLRFVTPPLTEPSKITFYLDAGSLIVFGVLTLVGWRRLPFAYTLYMLTTLYLIASVPIPREAQLVPSTARYMVAAIPVFLLLSGWLKRRPMVETLVVGGGFFFQAVFAVAYLHGVFIE